MSQGIAGSPAKSNPVAIGLARGWIKPAEPAKFRRPLPRFIPPPPPRIFEGTLDERKEQSRRLARARQVRQVTPKVQHPDLVQIAAEECALTQAPLVAVLGKCQSHAVVAVRDRVMLRAASMGWSHRKIAAEFGASRSSVSYAIRRALGV